MKSGAVIATVVAIGLIATWRLACDNPSAPVDRPVRPTRVDEPNRGEAQAARIPSRQPAEPESATEVTTPAAAEVPDEPSPDGGQPYTLDSWATIGPLERTPIDDSVFDAKYPDYLNRRRLAAEAAERAASNF